MYRWMQMFAVVLIISAISASAQQDPILGAWKLNVAKTKYEFGTLTNSSNVFTRNGPNGIKYVSERCCDAQGKKISNEIVAQFDGKDYPNGAPGDTGRDAVQVDRIDPHTYRVTYKLKGKPMQMNYWSVAKDGKTLAITSTGLTADNQIFHRLLVYDKQ